MLFTNAQVAQILKDHAAVLEATQADKFRTNAYKQAADNIENLGSDVYLAWKENKLEDIPGVGKSISAHLEELFRRGKVEQFEREARRVPQGIFAFLKLPGVGPKKALRLARELNIATVEDLKTAISDGKVARLSGFGKNSQIGLEEAIKEWEGLDRRILLSDALAIASRYTSFLKESPYVAEVEVLGSIRRGVPTVGDIDIAVGTQNPDKVLDHFVSYSQLQKIINRGDSKASVVLKNGFQVDVMTSPLKNWGALLQHFTGSREHNIHLREIAKESGWKLSEKLPLRHEKDVYKKLGMQFIPPQMREDRGEIELALGGKLPNLIEISDVKGDLQTHTVYSDGINTIDELVLKASQLSYQYIAITDHAPSANTNTTTQIKDWIKKRKAGFKRAEEKYPRLKIINGVEVNISSSGGLALPNELLAKFDWVIAAVHSGFKKSLREQTGRILSALDNPFVSVLGHPTGRVLLSRPPIKADWEDIFKKAAKKGKFMEINAHPSRLDLSGQLIRKASKLGVKFSLGTDAHFLDHLDNMHFGVNMAQRGWLEPEDIINTLSYKDLIKVLRR